MKHIGIRIYGIVQGVNFRYETKQKARSFALAGFVRNEPDGSVYIEAEGEEERLIEFLLWCQKGPRWAGVEKIEFNYEDKIRGFKKFIILK